MQEFMGSFIWMLAALAAVLALAWFALRFMQRRPGLLVSGKTRNDDALKFVRALPVGSRERVVIVEHRGQRWMLGVTAGGINTIASWTEAPAVSDSLGSTLADERPGFSDPVKSRQM